MPRKPSDDDDLGESFDDLYRDAEEEMRKARESLNKMRPGKGRTEEADRPRASRLRPTQASYEQGLDEPELDRPRKGCEALDDRTEDPERQERLGRELECRYMAELLENHQIHVMKPTEGSAAYEEALENYRRLKRDYERLCAEGTGGEIEGAIKRGARASGTRPASAAPLVGEELAKHREQRNDDGYDPQTEQQFNTDAKDLEEWAFQEKMAIPNTSDHTRAAQRKQAILDRYQKLGRKALQAGEATRNYPQTDDPKSKKGVKQLKEAFKAGYRENQ